jgi:uncharacterized protein (TIGR00156 family)
MSKIKIEEFFMEKKKLIIAVVLLALFVFSAYAQQGGFRGPSTDITTVAQARTLRDDTPVILRGKIERFLGNDRYQFSDETGSITIEIERRVWGSLSVDENDTVEISGEIDREWNSIEVEARSITKL